MALEADVMQAMKAAMKAKDSVALESLRAVKSAIILAKTESASSENFLLRRKLSLFRSW